jgi:hypothetical protein
VNRPQLQRVAAAVAALKARSLAHRAVPAVAEELETLGCTVRRWENGEGLTVDELEGDAHLDAKRDAKIRDLAGQGLAPLVAVTRRLSEPVPVVAKPNRRNCAQSKTGTGSTGEKRPVRSPRVPSTKRPGKRTRNHGKTPR